MSNSAATTTTNNRVAYFYDAEVGNFYYGQAHPMKPHRIRMTHNLLINYGLYDKMDIFKPHRCDDKELTIFHSDDYVDFLRNIAPDNMTHFIKQLHMFNVGDDCPVFDGIYEFSQIAAGGSVDGAVRLNHNQADVAVNWAGGLHHAKKSEASGFCYVNDIVLGIVELLKFHERVLYIDIDIHHGDGVEEAFYTTDRVMTLSFHKFGDFFPGTGDVRDIGVDQGKNYALNFPLHDGLDDATFESAFKPLVKEIMALYQPGAVVLQSGADSLTGDRLGCFNLSMAGHSMPMKFLKQFDVPVLLLGGGGYTIRNVARAWANETAVALGEQLSNDLPYNDYIEYYAPDYHLNIQTSNMNNLNTPEYIQKTLATLLTTLRKVSPPGMPRVQRPPDGGKLNQDEDEDDDLEDGRAVKRRAHAAELAPEFSNEHANVVLNPTEKGPAQRGGMKLLPSKSGPL